jgi:hypothetical protein
MMRRALTIPWVEASKVGLKIAVARGMPKLANAERGAPDNVYSW